MNLSILSIIAVMMLLVAIIGGVPYSFYEALRIVIAIVAATFCVKHYQRGNFFMVLVFAGVATIFNPIVPLHLTREVWIPIDIIVGGLFVYAGWKEFTGNKPKSDD